MLAFSLCSASLLLINKVIMSKVPLPSFISTLQFLSSTATACSLMATGLVPADLFVWHRIKPYLVYVGMFVTTIYCNFKALEHSNVETLIVFRSCAPCFVCLIEAAGLGRKLPSRRSVAAMVAMVGSAAGYVANDAQFAMVGFSAYTWCVAYFVVICVEMAVGKYVVGPQLGFASMWGPTLYTNTISIPPMVIIGLLTGEPRQLRDVAWSTETVLLIFSSCVVGVAISYTGFKCRSLVTATCFTVLGVANKMLTVLANVLLWDKHATPLGIGCLALCLIAASAYQQAPMRPGARSLLGSGEKRSNEGERAATELETALGTGTGKGEDEQEEMPRDTGDVDDEVEQPIEVVEMRRALGVSSI